MVPSEAALFAVLSRACVALRDMGLQRATLTVGWSPSVGRWAYRVGTLTDPGIVARYDLHVVRTIRPGSDPADLARSVLRALDVQRRRNERETAREARDRDRDLATARDAATGLLAALVAALWAAVVWAFAVAGLFF